MLAILQILIVATLAPLVHGIMKRLRANLQGRPGPSVIQPYRDLAKLWVKEAMLPRKTSPIALLAPGIAFGVALTFAAALPLVAQRRVSPVDIIALAFLLALGRFASSLAALDMRSAFTGMAASRDMTFASLVEPVLLVALLGAAATGGGPTLSALVSLPFGMAGALAFAAFFLVVLAETGRIPIDNQETHYELTMIHEGLGLEYSGWQLALVQFAGHIKQLCFLVLATLLLPGGALWAHLLWVAALLIVISIVETAFARLRLFEIPQLIATAFLLSLTSIALRVFGVLG
jgi:formate hydrogenlyase subunit 4